jgi:hypothetical protein
MRGHTGSVIVEELLYLVCLGILIGAVYTIVWPERTVAFRKRMGWHGESLLTGSVFYATPVRARLMGCLLTIILAAAIVMKILDLLR